MPTYLRPSLRRLSTLESIQECVHDTDDARAYEVRDANRHAKTGHRAEQVRLLRRLTCNSSLGWSHRTRPNRRASECSMSSACLPLHQNLLDNKGSTLSVNVRLRSRKSFRRHTMSSRRLSKIQPLEGVRLTKPPSRKPVESQDSGCSASVPSAQHLNNYKKITSHRENVNDDVRGGTPSATRSLPSYARPTAASLAKARTRSTSTNSSNLSSA